MKSRFSIFTVGHSDYGIDEFISLLKSHDIEAVADVRSQPYSRYHTQFNKEALNKQLIDAGINYVYLGKELGGRQEDPIAKQAGKFLGYDAIARSQNFRNGLDRLVEGSKKFRIAVMCACSAEKLTSCHRLVLVCRYLKVSIPDIGHIIDASVIKSQAQIEDKLIDETSAEEAGFFDRSISVLDRAYARQQDLLKNNLDRLSKNRSPDSGQSTQADRPELSQARPALGVSIKD